MNTREVQTALKRIGWPIDVDGSYGNQTFQAVWDFQRGFAFRDITIDGHAGSQTWQALADAAGGKASPHFAYAEFASPGNKWIKANRVELRALEVLRAHVGPIHVVSGYRDPLHNQAVGGAKNSQHLYGNACDVEQRWSVNLVRGLGVFSGIGIVKASGLVAHVDVRHDGPNTSGGTPSAPTLWYYT